MDLGIIGILRSRELMDPGIQEIQGEQRFYIRPARLPLDRSFVLNFNSIFTPY
jgi:hypothetical protein